MAGLRYFNLLGLFCTFFLAIGCEGMAVNIAGTITLANVTNFRFFDRFANPCEIKTAAPALPMEDAFSSVLDATTTEASTVTLTLSSYQLVAASIERIQHQLHILEQTDRNTDCNGISLDSLPATPPLDNLNTDQSIKQAYKSVIFLATHFRIIAFDRQLALNGVDDQPEDQLEENVPYWRFRRCGSESRTFQTAIQEITSQLEGLICTIVSGANEEQRASFRETISEIKQTILYRYHSSCSLLRTRDCLVLREAKQAAGNLIRKFNSLIENSEIGEVDDDDMLDNNL